MNDNQIPCECGNCNAYWKGTTFRVYACGACHKATRETKQARLVATSEREAYEDQMNSRYGRGNWG